MKDLTVILQDQPGTMATMSEALGNAGVNIEGICGFPSEGKGVIHVLVNDGMKAREVLQKSGFEIKREREVHVVDLGSMVGQAGSGGEMFRKIADAGINVDLVYFGEDNRLIIGADDLEKLKSVLN